MSLFTIVGGVAGFALGGPAGAVAGAQIGGGIDGYNSSRQDARAYEATGAYNSNQAIALAEHGASSVLNTARINGALSILGASFDAANIQMVASVNAFFQREAGFYNASLLRDEAEAVLAALELDIEQVEKQYGRILGAATVGYASSGVRIDIETDTPSLVLLDMATERELEIMILKQNGQEQARKLMNAAARSEFDGNVAAIQILTEGQQRANASIFAGFLDATTLGINADIEATNILYQGSVESGQILYDSRIRANNSRSNGDRALINGLINGGMSAYSAYTPPKPKGSSRVSPIAGSI